MKTNFSYVPSLCLMKWHHSLINRSETHVFSYQSIINMGLYYQWSLHFSLSRILPMELTFSP